MSKAILTIDQDELKNYVDALDRVMEGEDVSNSSTDLLHTLNGLKELLEPEIEEEVITGTKYKYGHDPIKTAELFLLRKFKLNREKMLEDVLRSHREIGQGFCERVVDHYMKLHPGQFIETSGGKVGDEL